MLKKWLKGKRKGSVAFEWIILSPLYFFISLVVIWFMFLCLAYVNYNNVASIIAEDLNMRQTGYEDRVAATNSAFIDKDTGMGQIVVDAQNDWMKAATNNLITANKTRFSMPFCDVVSVESHAYKGVDMNGPVEMTSVSDIKMAGGIIRVRVHYQFLGLNMVGSGYSVIA